MYTQFRPIITWKMGIELCIYSPWSRYHCVSPVTSGLRQVPFYTIFTLSCSIFTRFCSMFTLFHSDFPPFSSILIRCFLVRCSSLSTGGERRGSAVRPKDCRRFVYTCLAIDRPISDCRPPLRPALVTVCIQIDEFCIHNDGLCIRNDGFCIQNDGLNTNIKGEV